MGDLGVNAELDPFRVDEDELHLVAARLVEHRGDPNLMTESLNKLITWAKSQNCDLKPRPGEAFGFGYDDPKITEPDKFRYDLCLKIPNNLKINDDSIIEKFLPAGPTNPLQIHLHSF